MKEGIHGRRYGKERPAGWKVRTTGPGRSVRTTRTGPAERSIRSAAQKGWPGSERYRRGPEPRPSTSRFVAFFKTTPTWKSRPFRLGLQFLYATAWDCQAGVPRNARSRIWVAHGPGDIITRQR